MKRKVLIIGNSAKEYALAKRISDDVELFVAPQNSMMKDFATCLDVREDSVTELLEFVMENDISLTIVTSHKALKTNIVEVFRNNNQNIFAPTLEATNLIFDKAYAKKIMYKLRIPTPKFGIFEKQNMAVDYIKNIKGPFVIKTNEASSAVILTSQNIAKKIIDTALSQKAQKVIIEDYVWGSSFSFYAITDGYKALPIGSSLTYKHSLEGEGGQLTSGMGACAPNYKLSIENEYFIMDNVIYPLLDYLEINQAPYLGIIGVNGILTENNEVQILGFQPFMLDCDASSILEILDTDLLTLIDSCVIGSFSDEVDFIPQKEMFATSIVLTCKNKENNENIIQGLENLDDDTKIDFYPLINKNRYMEIEARSGEVLVLTTTGRTSASSTKKAYKEAESVNFIGVNYRRDICKSRFSED